MNQIKYMADLTQEELKNNNVFLCYSEGACYSILIKNALPKETTTKNTTDHLTIKQNAVLYYSGEPYYFHIISMSNVNTEYNKQFLIIYNYLFSKIEKPLKDIELTMLIVTLEEIFKVTPEKEYSELQTGVYGELLTVKYLYELGVTSILSMYHEDFYTKHDIEIDDKNRIEIKTAISDKRIHKFKHDQICREDVNVFVASVLLEKAKEGYSLFDLFEEIINLYNSPDSYLSLNKLMVRCNVSEENKGLTVSLEKALNEIKIFEANNLPHLETNIPKGVSSIMYDVDCSLNDGMEKEEIKKVILG